MNDTAIITAVHRDRYEMSLGTEILYGRLKKAAFYYMEKSASEPVRFPTVGDRVEIMQNTDGDSMILSVLERKSVFMRLNATQGLPDQAVAANFDYVFITMSLNKDFHMSKLERYLTVTGQSGGTPVILLTKADLMPEREDILAQIASLAPDIAVHCVSSYTGEGLSGLERYLAPGNTIVLLGSSGVGKSSLVNILTGAEWMKTGGIRETDAQGRHTTTFRQMFPVPEKIMLPDGSIINGGAHIIDTPGIRKLVMGDVSECAEGQSGIETGFADIEELTAQCRFADCGHRSEPGCAVKAALENGTLDMRHWKTYLALQKEEEYAKKRKQVLMKKAQKARRQM